MSGPKLQYFQEPARILGQVGYGNPPASWSDSTYQARNWTRDELVYSRGHKGPPYRTGGAFLVKHSGETRTRTPYAHYNKGNYRFHGNYEIATLPSVLPSIPDQTTTLFGLGATGISRARPGNASVNLAVAIGELREFHQLFRPGRGGPIQKGTQDFLNSTFGWAPIIRDLRKLYELQNTLDKQLDQLRRDNGKLVRRELGLGINTDRHVENYVGVYVRPSQALDGGNLLSVTRTYSSKYWFSGAFRYFIPDIKSPKWPSRAVDGLYGLDVTPEVVWNLVPWTWLADYFTNLGDVFANLSANAAENLVLDYGYVMGTVENRHDYACSFTVGNGKWKFFLTAERYSIVKQRVAAFPWGFGPNPGSLSGRQLAILAALGLNRFGERFNV